MVKDSENVSWNDNSSFFCFPFKFQKDKKGAQRKQKLFMILLILVTHMIQWSTVSIEKEQSLPSE